MYKLEARACLTFSRLRTVLVLSHMKPMNIISKTLSGERAAYFKMTTSGVFVSLFTSARIKYNRSHFILY